MKLTVVTKNETLQEHFKKFSSSHPNISICFLVNLAELTELKPEQNEWFFLDQSISLKAIAPLLKIQTHKKISLVIMGEDIKSFFSTFHRFNFCKFLKSTLSYESLENQLTLWLWDLNDRPHQTRHLTKGEYLIREGDLSDQMYWVIGGKLGVVKENERQEKINLAQIGPGELVGEMGFIESLPRTATVKAIEESDVLVINHEDFLTLFEKQPLWFKTLVINLARRLRQSTQSVSNLSHPENVIELEQDEINKLFNF